MEIKSKIHIVIYLSLFCGCHNLSNTTVDVSSLDKTTMESKEMSKVEQIQESKSKKDEVFENDSINDENFACLRPVEPEVNYVSAIKISELNRKYKSNIQDSIYDNKIIYIFFDLKFKTIVNDTIKGTSIHIVDIFSHDRKTKENESLVNIDTVLCDKVKKWLEDNIYTTTDIVRHKTILLQAIVIK